MELSVVEVGNRIFVVRGVEVMLDSDLAEIFEIETKVLNQTVRRHIDQFPSNLMFTLTKEEYLSLGVSHSSEKLGKGNYRKYLPKVFTEHGAVMLATVLNTKRAQEVKMTLIQAFIQLRKKTNAGTANLGPIEASLTLLVQKMDGVIDALKQLGPSTHELPKPTRLLAAPVAPLPKAQKSLSLSASTSAKIEAITELVARQFEMEVSTLKKNSRIRPVALPRQIAMFLIRKHTQIGFKEIGRLFGGKDHTTVLHACDKVETSIAVDEALRQAIAEIENQLT